MALSGTIKDEFCSKLCEVSMEWSATTNLLTGKATLTIKAYLDTSKAYKISSISAYTNKSYVKYYGKDYYFSTPAVTSKGKKLMGTVTINDVDTGSNMYCSLSLYVNKMKAYDTPTLSNVISYTTSAEYASCDGYIAIDKVDRLATSAVSGTLTLGTSNTLTVSPKHADLTHTVQYTCGTASGTLIDKAKTTSKNFSLPVDLAQQNTTGTTVSVKFTTTTYYNGNPIGSTSITKTYNIPTSLVPSCTFTVSDAQNYTTKYGAYVQGQSKYKIVVTPTLSQKSPIKTYTVTADGSTFNTASVTTDILKNSGTQTIKAKVTDQRNRTSSEVSQSVTVLSYAAPVISLLKVNRCDSNGTENDQGEYMKVTFNASVSSLNSKNTAVYKLSYQTTAGLDQHAEITLSAYTNNRTVTGGTYIFPADTSSAYYITLTVTDDFYTTTKSVGGSTAMTLINWGANGKSIGLGCVATVENAVEIAFKLLTSGGLINPVIPVGADLDEYKTPNFFAGRTAGDVENAPPDVSSGASYTLEVASAGAAGQVMQRFTVCSETLKVYIRHYYSNSWHKWNLA